MSRHGWKIGAVLAAAIAAVSWTASSREEPPFQQVIGINNTVLFMVTGNYGLSNPIYATVQGLLEHQQHIKIHLATADDGTPSQAGAVAGLENKLKSIVSFARRKTPSAGDVTFHRIPVISFDAAADRNNVTDVSFFGPPGPVGARQLGTQMQKVLSSWTPQEYIAIYEAAIELFNTIDPALLVLNTFMLPAIDAAQMQNRLHAFVTPNALIDNFSAVQPLGKVFWKFPMWGIDTGFPMGWSHIYDNLLVAGRVIWDLSNMPLVKQMKADLSAYGIIDPIDFTHIKKPHVPWISMQTEGAAIPLDYIPENVTCAGPLILDAAPAEEQDPELAAWLSQRKTVMINLGTVMKNWSSIQAHTMSAAVRQALDKHPDVQVLWKMRNVAHRQSELKEHLASQIADGRVRVVSWLKPDVFSILNTGHVIASVHHGGSNSYHEAVAAGIPHVILPMWVDCYNWAAIAESFGLGVYGSRGTAPDWELNKLADSLLAVIDDDRAKDLRAKAAKLGARYKQKTGREIAAAEVARWAATGRKPNAP